MRIHVLGAGLFVEVGQPPETIYFLRRPEGVLDDRPHDPVRYDGALLLGEIDRDVVFASFERSADGWCRRESFVELPY